MTSQESNVGQTFSRLQLSLKMDMRMILKIRDQEIVRRLQNEGLMKLNMQCIACVSFLTLTTMNDMYKMSWRMNDMYKMSWRMNDMYKMSWRCLNYGFHMKNHTVSVRTREKGIEGRYVLETISL